MLGSRGTDLDVVAVVVQRGKLASWPAVTLSSDCVSIETVHGW